MAECRESRYTGRHESGSDAHDECVPSSWSAAAPTATAEFPGIGSRRMQCLSNTRRKNLHVSSSLSIYASPPLLFSLRFPSCIAQKWDRSSSSSSSYTRRQAGYFLYVFAFGTFAMLSIEARQRGTWEMGREVCCDKALGRGREERRR